MAFFTRPDLDDRQFKQISGSTLTLSGETNFVGTLKSKDIEIDASTGSSSIGDALTWDGTKITLSTISSGGQEYTGATPAVLSSPVGGVSNGYVMSGKTLSDILEDILIETLNPSITAPSHTLTENTTNTQEVGVLVNFDLCSTFSQGSIVPQYDATGTCIAPTTPRSGPANNYCYTGAGGLSCSVASAVSNNSIPVAHTLTEGSNTFSSYVSYDASSTIAYDSSGGVFAAALGAGNTTTKNVTLTGRYCRFYGATSATVTNSTETRNLPQKDFQTANVNTFCLTTGTVETKFDVALPPSRTISCVIDLGNLNADITSCYVCLGTVTVNDGGGSGTARTYNLYELSIGAPYSPSTNHQITTA